MEHMTLSEGRDKWSYIWGSTSFSSSRIYKELMDHPLVDQAYKWIWDCPCQPKHKVFFWLLLKDRLSTRNILRRRHMNLESYNCVLCNNSVEETLEHLFLHCNFARQCWSSLGIVVPQNSSFPGIVSVIKVRMQSQFFMVAVILMSWSIWKSRNDLIFKGIRPQLQNCRANFVKELKLVLYRIKPSLLSSFELWLHNFTASQ